MNTQFEIHSRLRLLQQPLSPAPGPPFCRRELRISTQFRPLLRRRSFSFLRLRVSNCVSKTNSISGVKVEDEQKENQEQVRRAYPFHEIEPKWQKFWEENKTFRTPDEIDTSKPKYYVLDMFPYPRFLFSLILYTIVSEKNTITLPF